MRSTILQVGVASFLTIMTLTACEYEFKDQPASSADEAGDEEENAPEDDEEKAAEPAQQRKPDVRPLLPAGKPYAGSSTLPANSKKIDLLNLAATNQATLTTNVPGMEVANLFDGSDDTLLRTPDINPLETTISFTNPTKFKALRVRSTYSDFAVAVQIDGGERLILDPIPEGDWAVMVWAAPVTAKNVVVHTLRKVRDNYVHVNEIEIYQ